jgi:hypothetical protein
MSKQHCDKLKVTSQNFSLLVAQMAVRYCSPQMNTSSNVKHRKRKKTTYLKSCPEDHRDPLCPEI